MSEQMIYKSINGVMREIGAVAKNKKNTQGAGFMYRGIDDVMNALQPALINNNLFIVPDVISEKREERVTAKGALLLYTRLHVNFKFFASDGSFVEAKVIGEAMDSGDKATNKAMSIAYKYACFQVFCIPTEEMNDPNSETHNLATNQNAKTTAEDEDNTKALNTAKIDDVKVKSIQSLCAQKGISESAVCARYKVDALNDLTLEQYIKAMAGLEKTPDKK